MNRSQRSTSASNRTSDNDTRLPFFGMRSFFGSMVLLSAVLSYLSTTRHLMMDPMVRMMSNHDENLFHSPYSTSSVSRSPAVNETASDIHGDDNTSNHSMDKDNQNEFVIRHSVLTRFMIGQSNQPVLARARLELFKTFCYPTMFHQTHQDYFWLVLVDPGLEPDIIDEMTSLLQDFSVTRNAYLILTNNTKWAEDGISPKSNKRAKGYGVNLQTVAQEFQKKKLDIRTGDTDRLLATLRIDDRDSRATSPLKSIKGIENAFSSPDQKLILVETLLDADDGLHHTAIEYMHRDILERSLLQQHISKASQPTLESTWWLLCASEHLEWHNRDIFRINADDFAQGRRQLSDGVVGRRAIPPECISAGFTRVGLTNILAATKTTDLTFPEKALYNHFQTHQYMSPCDNEKELKHCYWRTFREFPGAFRSRSITSDSMSQLDPDLTYDYKNKYIKDSKLHIDDTDKLWSYLEDQFFVSRKQAQQLSVYLYQNREGILQENEESRCIPGFPCLGHSKETIQKLKQMVVAQEAYNGAKPKRQKTSKLSSISSKVRIVQPTTIPLHHTDVPAIQKRHQCIEAIRERQMDLVGDAVRSYKSTPGERKALLVNPAYHRNVGDHMITLGEIQFLRRLGVDVSSEMEQCGQPWQDLIPDCEKASWWKDSAYQARGTPVLLHGGGNWGDLWRRNQDLRIRSFQTLLEKNHTLLGMPQSLYYQDETLKRQDAKKIEAVISSISGSGTQKPRFLWREQYSYDQAMELYPSAQNMLMPDIAFQLGPYEPLPVADSRAVDIVVFMREDHESLESKNRNDPAIRSILKSLVGGDKARETTFRIVDWNDRLDIFDSDDILFSETAIQLLSMGRILVCDRLHASILAYLSGIPFVYVDQVSGKISKTLGVALDSAEGCQEGRNSNFAQAQNLTQALGMALNFLRDGTFQPDIEGI